MVKFFNRLFRGGENPPVKAPGGVPEKFAGDAAAPVGSTGWLSWVRSGARLYGLASTAEIDSARSCDWFSAYQSTTIEAAEGFLRHEFDLLGSGPFTPPDPERPTLESGYKPIDWYLDPVRNLRFPRGVPFKDWDLYEMRPENADVKYPWELARCQHFTTLTQAYLITGEDRFAEEVAHELDDFMDANPIGVGINYTCTMDVGIRALNWALALDALRNCDALEEAWWSRAYNALFDHCAFIFDNLENHYEVTSNHFLSNVVGLHFACQPFRGHERGQEWHAFCRKALEEEITVQVLDDGADFESSIPYHRLVCELFLGSGWLARVHGEALSDAYYARLGAMVAYLAGVLRPDGMLPQIGDADDGRLHIFSRAGAWDPQFGAHILGPAGHVLGRDDGAVDGADQWEVFWWGMPVQQSQTAQALAPVAKMFPDAGHAVWRDGGDYLLFCNSIVGTKGFGNHKHNDQLSFEFHHDGRPLIVDPGSWVYTSDFDARNKFRGTGYHNTVMVDNEEQNETRSEWIFRLFDSGTPEHLAFDADGPCVAYSGRHVGYSRLDDPVVHRRDFLYEKSTGVLVLRDTFTGNALHLLRWHFHLAPNVKIFSSNGAVVWFENGGDGLYGLLSLSGTPAVMRRQWYSPSYGKRVPCQTVDYSELVDLTHFAAHSGPQSNVERFYAIAPANALEGGAVDALVAQLQQNLVMDGNEA
jgi:hypothetical protein